jgi:hypothetical protein
MFKIIQEMVREALEAVFQGWEFSINSFQKEVKSGFVELVKAMEC